MVRQVFWSPTRIDTANYCRMRYYLKYIERVPTSRLSVYLKGGVLHKLIENFWKRLAEPGERVVKKGKGPRYSNPEEFAEHARGMWDYSCIRAENSDNPVAWRFDNERWVIRSRLEEICSSLFPLLVEEGPPIFSELGFKFKLLGKKFTGKIDEIRKREGKIVIRDYKSGWPHLGKIKIDHDPQLTVYNAALVALVRQNPEFARELGLEGLAQMDLKESDYVDPSIEEEFFMIESPRINEERIEEDKEPYSITHPTTRRNEHFFEVIKMIDGVQAAVDTGQIYPERGRKCDYCDVQDACVKKLEEVGQGFVVDRNDQFSLDFAVPSFAQKESSKKKMEKKKDPAQTRLPWRYNKPSPN